jgi:hypothetical protein
MPMKDLEVPKSAPMYRITRGSMVSSKLASESEVEGFLEMCGLSRDSIEWAAAFTGWPLHIDGADIRFELQRLDN